MSTLAVSPPSRDAACSSGPSPTARSAHLIGLGRVGRALLTLPEQSPVRFIAASDRSATVYAADGLDAEALVRHKATGASLAALPAAAPLPLALALSIADADLIVDATDSDLAPAARTGAIERTRRLLRAGKTLVLAAKTPLLLPAAELAAHRGQLGIAAVFGGTGGSWPTAPRALACVANATTTALIDVIERGGTLAEGLVAARRAGLVEADPTQDLDGRDAALKLALAGRLAFARDLDPDAIERPRFAELDPELLRRRRARGATTRLVGRIEPDGAATLAYEELPLGDPLTTGPNRVAWLFTTAAGRRLLTLGDGIGAVGTAQALRRDLVRFATATAGANR